MAFAPRWLIAAAARHSAAAMLRVIAGPYLLVFRLRLLLLLIIMAWPGLGPGRAAWGRGRASGPGPGPGRGYFAFRAGPGRVFAGFILAWERICRRAAVAAGLPGPGAICVCFAAFAGLILRLPGLFCRGIWPFRRGLGGIRAGQFAGTGPGPSGPRSGHLPTWASTSTALGFCLSVRRYR